MAQKDTLPKDALPNGPAAAAILASGIGSLTLGILTTLAAAVASISRALNFFDPVGPLSGKTILTVLIWLAAWGIVYLRWRDKNTDFGKVFTATLVLIALGILGTFPPFFESFAP